MFRTVRSSIAALAIASAASSVLAQEAPAQVQEEIQSLRSRLERLEKQSAAQQEVNQAQASVLADAERRSQLLQSGAVTAGYDKGFFIQSADGKFVLKPGLQFQFRSVTNFSESVKDSGDDSLESGFEIRRVRFRFDGNAFSKDLKYSFVWDTNRNSGAVTLLDAYVDYKFADELSVKIGQFKESWTHEKDVSGFRQLAVDRTLVDTVLGGNVTDRVQGVALVYGSKDNPLRGELAFSDGANSKNTDYRDSDGTGNTRVDSNYGVGGRIEYKTAGDWNAYKDFTAKGAKEDLLIVGAGFDYTEAGDSNVLRTTIDGQFENGSGLGLYAAGLANFSDAAGGDSTDYGLVAQGSYLWDPAWEAFARYSLTLLDEDVNDNDTFNEVTLGVNYYLGDNGSAGHGAKLTFDFVWLPDGTPGAQTGLGYTAGEDAQYVVRGQLQLVL